MRLNFCVLAIIYAMREVGQNLDTVKERVKKLQGIEVKLLINRGRNRFISFDGSIEDIYPNVFTVKSEDAESKLMTFSYNDVMTKNIRFYKKEK